MGNEESIIRCDKDGVEIVTEKLTEITSDGVGSTSMSSTFTGEECLIASPVVLGFALDEKLWLEFTLAGVEEIAWNEAAYEILVLPSIHKDIVRLLVETYKYHGAKNINDDVQDKGK